MAEFDVGGNEAATSKIKVASRKTDQSSIQCFLRISNDKLVILLTISHWHLIMDSQNRPPGACQNETDDTGWNVDYNFFTGGPFKFFVCLLTLKNY